MYHDLGCNIVEVANQLSFTYKGLVSKLQVFVISSIDTKKTTNFIYAIEEKQKIWYDILTT